MLKESKAVKTEIDIFLSVCLKFDMREIRISFFRIKTAFRSSRSQMFFPKVVLKISQYSQENTGVKVSF